MPTILDPRHAYAGFHNRFWLVLAAILAFVIAALWAQPTG